MWSTNTSAPLWFKLWSQQDPAAASDSSTACSPESKAGAVPLLSSLQGAGQRSLAAGAIHIWASLLAFLLLPVQGATVGSVSGSVKKKRAALKEAVPVEL